MEEKKSRESINDLRNKISKLEWRQGLDKEVQEDLRERLRDLRNEISELKEESISLSMDVPTEYVLQQNLNKHRYSLWMWKEDVPILIKTDVYTEETRAEAEKLYKELIRNLKKKPIRDLEGDDNLPF